MVDGHIIVIQDDKQVVRRRTHIVETFESKTAAHGAVAYHCNDVASRYFLCIIAFVSHFLLPLCSDSHTESRRDAVGSMTAGEGVIFTFCRVRERADAVKLAVGAEIITATSQYFVSVSLMTYVPYYSVIRRVIDIMQGDSQFDDAQTRRKMPRIDR